MSKKLNLVFLFLLQSSFAIFTGNSSNLSRILCDPVNRAEFSGFFDEVLRVIPSDKFYKFIDSILKDAPNNSINDSDFYSLISSRIAEIESVFAMKCQLASLSHQKEVLGGQLRALIDNNEINGCVEIGTPCTYISTLSSKYNISGPVYYINEQSGKLDFIQAFAPKLSTKLCFYDKFVRLNNYDPISEKDIPSNSVDLVVCVIGLHHIPVDKIEAFVLSINRILRPGGTFILRDHDAYTDELKSIAYVAHSVYNAIIPHEPLSAELSEIRNFQSLDYWIGYVESHGFTLSGSKCLQENDPTKNTMIRFVKNISDDDLLYIVSSSANNSEDYKRDAEKTYLGAPEWFNVDISKDYAEFIEHTPFYQYPYFSSIKTYWDIFGNSWRAAAKKNGNIKVLCSEYTQMNLFVGIAMTLEYGLKGVISLPVKAMFKGSEPSIIKAVIADKLNQIDKFEGSVRVESDNSGIKIVGIARYKEFLRVLRAMAKTDISIIEIAGNKEIHVKARSCSPAVFSSDIEGCSLEYTWHIPTKPEYTYYAFTVKVEKLIDVIKTIDDISGFEVIHVHDF